jgi:hypothetical protein
MMTFEGSSGKRYIFTAYPLENNCLPEPAVYIIAHMDDHERIGNIAMYYQVYVSQTNNLQTCFIDHPKEDCFKQHSANIICIHLEQNPKRRLEIVADLLAKFTPSCNDI